MKSKTSVGIMLTLLLIGMLTMAVSTKLIKQAEASPISPKTVNVLWLIDRNITDFPLATNHFIALDPEVPPLKLVLDPVNFPGIVPVQFNFAADGQQNFAIALGDPAQGAPGITPNLLHEADIVMIATQRIAVRGWDPQTGGGGGLTQAEKNALLDFVSNGGVLWVFGEAGAIWVGMQYFNPSLNNDIAQNSMANLFGVTYSGNFAGSSYELTVPYGEHPIINGPFGTVTNVLGGGAGNIVSLGPDIDCVIANPIGCYLAVGPSGLLFTTDTEPFKNIQNSVFINNVFAFLANFVPRVPLSIKLSGEHDYLFMERVKVRVSALVKDIETMESVSGANVTIEIYDPEGNLWVSDDMTETLSGKGVYEWESSETVRKLMLQDQLHKGVYLVYVEASFEEGPTASDILEFHIDPPIESSTSSLPTPLYYLAAVITFIAGITVGIVLAKRHKRLQVASH